MASKLPPDELALPDAQEPERKPTLYLAVPGDQLKGLEIGDKVTFTARGKVVGVDIHKNEKGKSRGNINIEDPTIEVKTGSSQMEDFDEDLDGD